MHNQPSPDSGCETGTEEPVRGECNWTQVQILPVPEFFKSSPPSPLVEKQQASLAVHSVAYSPDGNTLAVALEYGVQLYKRTETGFEPIFLFEGSLGDALKAVTFSFDGELVAAGNGKGEIYVWTSASGLLTQQWIAHDRGISSAVFSPTKLLLVSAGNDRTIGMWKEAGQLIKRLTGHIASINAISFSSDGSKFLSASTDRTVHLWSSIGELLSTLTQCPGSISQISFSPDSTHAFFMVFAQGVGIWNLNSSNFSSDSWLLPPQSFSIKISFPNAFQLLPDGKHLLAACSDGNLRWYALDSKKMVYQMQASDFNTLGIAIHPLEEEFISHGRKGEEGKVRTTTINVWAAKHSTLWSRRPVDDSSPSEGSSKTSSLSTSPP